MPRYTLVKQNLRSVIYRMCIENRFHLLQSMLCSFFIMKIIVWSISVVSHWPRGPRRGSAAVRLLGLQVRTPPKAWMSVTCESCMWSGSGLCVGMIDHWSREVLLSVACLNAIVKPRQWGDPDPIGVPRHGKDDHCGFVVISWVFWRSGSQSSMSILNCCAFYICHYVRPTFVVVVVMVVVVVVVVVVVMTMMI